MNIFDKLRLKLPLQGACALITSQVNRRYFTDFNSSDGYLLIFENEAFFLVDSRYFEAAKKSVKANVVLLEKAAEQINGLFASHGIQSVYIESDRVTVGELEFMKSKFENVTIDFSETLFKAIRSLRMIKTPDEVKAIKTAQTIAETALLRLLDDGFSYDNTERKLAAKLDYHMKDGSAEVIPQADDISFETILLSGENTSMPHGVPSERSVCDGDALLIDFGAVYEGLHSDMTRTAFINNINDEYIKIWEIVLEAKNLAMAAIKPGIPCNEVDKIARDYITSKGYGDCFGHGLGHSVGLEIHEYPAFNKTCEELLTPGMIMTVEPGIYIPGKFGVRLEDMVVITESGYDNLASMSIMPEFTVKFL
ncbi:MAG: aminopeptidase P family protein [Ruminococcus sp.]|jgi:Xaa-Pro aminopeptidase|nr:aminopeptidase P family protein [Ruminococcus sp.]